MKVSSLVEASTLTPLEKMKAFDAGTRKENIKACSPEKLMSYYNICIENDLKNAQRKIKDHLSVLGRPELEKYYKICKDSKLFYAEGEIADLLTKAGGASTVSVIGLSPDDFTDALYKWVITADIPSLKLQIDQAEEKADTGLKTAIIYLIISLTASLNDKAQELIKYILTTFSDCTKAKLTEIINKCLSNPKILAVITGLEND